MNYRYYNLFDEETNNGRVFDTNLNDLVDLPVKHLTPTEVVERTNWRNKMERIYAHYADIDSPQVSTTELLLQTARHGT
jgi:hypothetical protein